MKFEACLLNLQNLSGHSFFYWNRLHMFLPPELKLAFLENHSGWKEMENSGIFFQVYYVKTDTAV